MSKQRVSIAAGALALLVVASSLMAAFPKPSVYPIAWQYKFKYNTPKRVSVTIPGSNVPQAYWYVTFTVTAKEIDDIRLRELPEFDIAKARFLPEFDLLTRDGKLIHSDKDVPTVVYDAIRRREGRKSLEAADKLRGVIRLGEDQARDGIAVWPEPEARMGTFSIFYGGLSGETVYLDKNGNPLEIKDWTKVTDEERKSFKVLHKTLQVTYTVPGDEMFPGENPVNFVKQEWVMR